MQPLCYPYKYHWDYVQKYVDHHHKNMLSGYLPKAGEPSRPGKDKVGGQGLLQRAQQRQDQGEAADAAELAEPGQDQ